jgi:hypothetical protein
MKYVKMLGLLAVAASAMMAFAGTASATVVKSNGATYTGTIHATAGETTLHGALGTVTCLQSTVHGTLNEHTGTGATTARGPISSLTFSECGTDHVTVKQAGTLEVHKTNTTGNGILTSTGAEVEITTTSPKPHLTCIFTTNNTQIGEVVGGTTAKLNIAATIPRTGGSFFCGGSGQWTGSYTITTPHNLTVH